MKGDNSIGGRTIQGLNDIATKAPWMVAFLKNKEDATTYAHKSSKKIWFKCPDCGYEREKRIMDVCKDGYSCPICGDKISRPNKFARNVLSQLPIDNLQFEYSAEWTDGKRYDNYFEYQGRKYILEIDGDQHHIDCEWGKASHQELNDTVKDFLAFSKAIEVIRIDAPFGRYDEWIENFKQSAIGELVKDIDWNKVIERTERSLVKEICDFYNTHSEMSTSEIAKQLNLNRHLVTKYLKIGAKIGFCNYSVVQARKNTFNRIRDIRLKDSYKIRVEDLNHNLIGIYQRTEYCIKAMREKYPEKSFSETGIIRSCSRYDNPYQGFYFSYEGVDVLQKYYIDNEVFQKVCKCFAEHDNNLFADEVKEILGIKTDRSLIISYLKVGTMLGLCDYSYERMAKRRGKKTGITRKVNKVFGVRVKVFDSEKMIGEYSSIREAAKELRNKYPNEYFSEKGIGKALNKHKGENNIPYKWFTLQRVS